MELGNGWSVGFLSLEQVEFPGVKYYRAALDRKGQHAGEMEARIHRGMGKLFGRNTFLAAYLLS